MNDREFTVLLSLILVTLVLFSGFSYFLLAQSNAEVEAFKKTQTKESTMLELFDDYVIEPDRNLPFPTVTGMVFIKYMGAEKKTLEFWEDDKTFTVARKVGTTFRVKDSTLRITKIVKNDEYDDYNVSIQRVK